MKYLKTATYLFFIVFVTLLFYIGYQAQRDLDTSLNSNTQVAEKTGELIALPVQEDNLSYTGKIQTTDEGDYKYTLTKDGKVLLYLKSDNQDLSLLSGLETEIVGDLQGRYQGIAIINVKSIKLK